MPHHKSAAKRMVTNEKARRRNIAARSRMRSALKTVRSATRRPEGEAAYRSAVSLTLANRADRDYSRYLAATEPGEIHRLFHRGRLEDNLSTTALLGGEALIGIGLYVRFLRRSALDRLALEWRSDGCAVSLRF